MGPRRLASSIKWPLATITHLFYESVSVLAPEKRPSMA
ncbi:predicted protein [Plenodomus lingam JN3]|uniref:Predicted protein n=1 Tax=Leptosphaeria maculans (strain JN3 / isolate v23.1.3 / race Av1-4-5-6-7-8) TaxID=985895 RepID=E4ZZ51_LEPMJ|nr:predicted protein [Plenodomus lingam JN3]CBX96646.1 predicted protein [Plenodomus lingam JN3]